MPELTKFDRPCFLHCRRGILGQDVVEIGGSVPALVSRQRHTSFELQLDGIASIECFFAFLALPLIHHDFETQWTH
jgi:hypothetical protein